MRRNIREEFDIEYINKLVPRLKKALRDEISSAIGYTYIANKLVGKDVIKIQEELLEHSKEEFEHFQEISEYVSLIGLDDILKDIEIDYSVVNYNPMKHTIEEVVEYIQSLEREAYNDYKAIFELAKEYGDLTTTERFKKIAGDEREHFKDLAYFNGDIFQEKLNEIKGDHDLQNKKLAIKKAIAKKKIKCPNNMSPHLVKKGDNIKYVCKPKDKEKAKLLKKVAKKMASKKFLMKQKTKKAQDTKNFRYGNK